MVDPLPNELVDSIIENLDPSIDKATFISCALVGSAWVCASQRGIFHTISLKIPSRSYGPPTQKSYAKRTKAIRKYMMAMDQLGALLDKKPGLASCVRCLELRDIKARLAEGDAMYISIAGLINQLSNVKKLLLFDVDWDALSVSLELALTRMFKAPSVTEVVLENFGIATFASLTSLLSHLANLKMLKAVGLSCWDWSAPNPAGATGSPPPGPIQLDKLVFDSGAFLSWFRQADCPFRLENLRHLQAFQFQHCAGKLHPVSLLQQVGNSLRKLTLDRETNLGNFHLGYTPNLRSLKLVNIDQNDWTVPWIRSLFEPLLKSDQKRCPLQRLTIQLSVRRVVSYWTPQWLSFDALLAKPEFDLLETIDILIKC